MQVGPCLTEKGPEFNFGVVKYFRQVPEGDRHGICTGPGETMLGEPAAHTEGALALLVLGLSVYQAHGSISCGF